MIMRDVELATTMQQKEEDGAQKSMEKEQKVMKSTPTKKDLLLVQRVLYLYHPLQSSIPQNLGVTSKVTTLEMDSIFFFADHLLHLQTLFRDSGKMLLWE